MDYRGRLIPALIVSIIIALIVVYFTASETGTNFWGRLANNPGGLFRNGHRNIFCSWGLYTLATVLGVRNSIISFADFIYRTEQLINETGSSDYVRIMLHTPAPGCLVLPSSIWRRLANKIQVSEKFISLTCLSQCQMARWFDEYKKDIPDDRIKIMEDRIRIGLDKSRLIKERLKQRASQAPSDYDVSVLETSWDHLPLCYYIANSRRAIVVAPFFLPRPEANIYAGNVHSRTVQMIGFETTDFHIVETVHQEIDTRRNALRAKTTSPDGAPAKRLETPEGGPPPTRLAS